MKSIYFLNNAKLKNIYALIFLLALCLIYPSRSIREEVVLEADSILTLEEPPVIGVADKKKFKAVDIRCRHILIPATTV